MKTAKMKPLPKALTGIEGLDEITEGGIPKGRPTLVCGSAGCGKTLFAVQFLAKGVTLFNEPGVFMSFEETADDLSQNVSSLGLDLNKMVQSNKLRIDHVRVEKSEIEETGEYDLEALFIRLNYAIDSIGAKRVVLDTIESLFGGISDDTLLRAEIRRLFMWLKSKGVTAIITGERGESTLTRQGLEEYVSDCVILLDFRVVDQIATRRLRIIKYRGSSHGTNEYPFQIDEQGISVLPITSLKLDYRSSKEIISTGLPSLDKLFNCNGTYRGNSVIITGPAGTAKTTLASYFVKGACERRERVIYFSFEESPSQLERNMGSVGINFGKFIKSKLLTIHSSRPSLQGLEMHLLLLNKLVKELKPRMVIVDPISSLVTVGSNSEVRAMLVRLMDMLKVNGINAVFTALSNAGDIREFDDSVDSVSSLSDTWIKVFNENYDGKNVRKLSIVKSRGMGHLNGSTDFIINEKGIQFISDLKMHGIPVNGHPGRRRQNAKK
jgi:circadian clock protein KaiC